MTKTNASLKTGRWARLSKLYITALLSLIVYCTQAQTVEISGTVTDASTNLPIPGASVYVKGTQTGAVTNVEGKFTLKVKSSDETLVVSFIGYEASEVEIAGKSSFNIILTPTSSNLEEVIVTALGIKKEKKALGYSVGEVKSEAIVNASETNVVAALSGKVAGVVINSTSSQAGSGANITIRGNSSITGNNRPLMVVDGVPYKNDQFGNGSVSGETGNTSLDLDLSIVENVSVLKGTAAAALYGSEAANGVIIISTKKGSSNMKPQISFSQSYSFDKVIELPQQKTWAQGIFDEGTGLYTYQDGELHPDGSSGFTSASWGPRISSIPGAKIYDKYAIFQVGNNLETNVNIRGGSEKVNYFTSFSNQSQEGILEEMTLNKTSITSNIDIKINDKLKVSTSLNFTDFKNNRFWEGFSNSSFMVTFLSQPFTWNPYPIYRPDGTLRSYRGGSRSPYTWLKDNMIRNIERKRFTPNVGIDFQILDGLKFTAKTGIDFYTNNVSDKLNSGGYDQPTGLYDVKKNNNFFINTDFILTYAKKINDDLSFEALVGNNIQSTKWEGSSFTGTGFVLPNVYNKDNCSTIKPNDSRGQQRSVSLYGQFSISYKSMLYLTATARNDWTSTLPSESRINVYPSTTLAFIFSELIDNKSILSFGKVSASYSEVGNTPGAYANSFSQGVPWLGGSGFVLPYNGVTGFFPTTTALNPNLKAEKTKEIELNIDSKFLNNRIGMELSLYKGGSDNQIMNVSLEAASGYSNALMNIGEIENKGIELLLTGTPIKMKDFSWDIAFNWSKNKTTVKKLGLNGDPINMGYDLYAVEGNSFPVIYGNGFVRDNNGKMVIDDDLTSGSYGYPLISNERKVLGKVEADWQGGMRNTFTYKNITLSAFIDMRVGGYIQSGTDSYLMYYGLTKPTENRPENNLWVMDGVKGHFDSNGNVVLGVENDIEVRYDSYWRDHVSLENFVQKSDFIKLREVSLFYAVPKTWLAKTKFVEAISLGFVGKNLWHKYDDSFTGADPEASNFGDNSTQQGLSWYMFPNTKTYTFKLSVTF
ncbi:MAG: SusC/RagA family TonB-linked outer membrane protein [Tenuifilaceae bacterium]